MKTVVFNKRLGSALILVICLLSRMCFAQTSQVVGSTVSLDIKSCGEWIDGVPLWLVATFKNNDSQRDVVGPTYLDYAELRAVAYSWQLKLKDSPRLVFAQEVGTWPRRDYLEDRAWPGIPIPSNGSYRMVFPLQWQDGIGNGEYELSIRFNKRGSSSVLCSASTIVVVRLATETERSFMDLVYPSRSDWWFRYEVPDIEQMPKSLNAAFGFELLLRGSAVSKGPISSLDPEKFRLKETTLFDPELAAVRYEILVAQRKNEAAQELREKTLALYPGVERLFSGRGYMLKWLHKRGHRDGPSN